MSRLDTFRLGLPTGLNVSTLNHAFRIRSAKDAANFAKHGLSLGDFEGFDAEPIVVIDARRDYGETRYRAFGRVGGEGRCLVYAERDGNIRLISYRPAREKEMRRYE